MDVTVNQIGKSKVAVISSPEVLIADTQDALDLMASIQYLYDCHKMIIPKAAITEGFFDLKTGIAGDILQKYTNYNVKLVVIGEFSSYQSKSLADFIRESNKGNQILFLSTIESGIEKLHNIL
jgi:hypothetical protein